MAQEYIAIIYKDNTLKVLNPQDYECGSELLQHSFIDNKFMNAVCKELIDNPQHVIWLGNMLKPGCALRLNSNQIFKFFKKVKNHLPVRQKDFNTIFDFSKNKFYLINKTKMVYINLKSVCKKNRDDFGEVIHPLSILTASSNGKGSGDYSVLFPDYDLAGSWCDDLIYISKNKPEFGYIEQKVNFKLDTKR